MSAPGEGPAPGAPPGDAAAGQRALRRRAGLVRRALSRPGPTLRSLAHRHGWRRVRFALFAPLGGPWSQSADAAETVENPSAAGPHTSGLRTRRYATYAQYIAHQAGKLALLDLTEYDRVFSTALADRLAEIPLHGRSVLCLAARIGSEVRAFHRHGAFAVGVDLEPGPGNPLVLPGDFHALVFPDACVDLVYSNSLDHALRFTDLLGEVHRVLKPGGTFLVDVQLGTARIGEFDDWAAIAWTDVDDVVRAIAAEGFEVVSTSEITVPWAGSTVQFRAVGR